MPAKKPQTHRAWGRIEKRASGNYRASFKGPDHLLHRAPHTFKEKKAAEAWLNRQKQEIDKAEALGLAWKSPKAQEENGITVSELVDLWLAGSTSIKKESTRQTHRRRLNARALRESFTGFDSLAQEKVADIDRKRIVLWWKQVQANWPEQQSTNTFAYKRLHTAFEYARTELEIIDVNPVQVAGANAEPRSDNRDKPLMSLEEAATIANSINPRLKAPVLILQWAGLRLGELLELRRKDIVDKGGVMTLRISRNAQRIRDDKTGKQVIASFDTPKTDAGNREIDLPSKIAETVRLHLKEYVTNKPEALIVTTEAGKQMMDTNFRSRYKHAAKKAGRADLTPHDNRRFFGTMLVTESGISLEEARRIMGHENIEQLLEYMRAAANYKQTAATNLDKLL